ncbi:hypothetical protein TD95_002669 [Thielaviopsis punctulata]|uniref:Uncharacterized protein n=1 Tax=Thielaviopsis punctulata TaxID=72032 RepID=A0A0F4ZJ74_9PEZI|nr:hypothetical protein TD95_002669 [Thielaviopsis punctulata]
MESDQAGFEATKVSRRDRWKGKLFGKDRHSEEANVTNVHDFLNSTADTLQAAHSTPINISSPGFPSPAAAAASYNNPPPRALARIDTTAAPRYPQASSVSVADPNAAQYNNLAIRPNPTNNGFGQLAPSPDFRAAPVAFTQPKKNKGLSVSFTDSMTEIIGDGGDECEEAVMEVSKRKAARLATGQPAPTARPMAVSRMDSDPGFMPRALKRSQTGYIGVSQMPEDEPSPTPQQQPPTQAQRSDPPTPPRVARGLAPIRPPDENRRSFIEIHQAEMRMDEARALAKARSTSIDDLGNMTPSPPSSSYSSQKSPVAGEVSPEYTPMPAAKASGPILGSVSMPVPVSVPASTTTSAPVPVTAPLRTRVSPPHSSTPPSVSGQSSYSPAAPSYTSRSPYNIYTNSDLSRNASTASTKEPPSAYNQVSFGSQLPYTADSSATESRELTAFVARTKHLFELFRLHAETSGPLQYCDLRNLARAALWWFLRGRQALEILIRNRAQAAQQDQLQYTMEKQQAYANLSKAYWLCEEAVPEVMRLRSLTPHPEVEEVRMCLKSSLRKLANSMSRNDFMPPEEPFLPQTTDKFIWVDYPQVPQDVLPVLTSSVSTSLLGNSGRQNAPPPLTVLESIPLGDSTDYFNFSRVLVDAVLFEQGSRESQGLTFRCFLSTIRPKSQPNLTFLVVSQNGDVQLRIQGSKGGGITWEDVKWKAESNTIDVRLPRGFQLAIHCTPLDFRMLWNMHEYGTKMQSLLYPRTEENVVFRGTMPSFQYFDSDPQSRVFPKESLAGCELGLFETIHKENAATGPRYHHRGFRIAIITGPKTRTLSGVTHLYPPSMPVQFGFLRGENETPALQLKFEGNRSRGSMVISFRDEKERLRFHTIIVGSSLNQEKIFAEVPIKSYNLSPRLFDQDGFVGISDLAWKGVRVVNDDNGEDIPTTVLSDKLRILTDFMNGSVTDRVNVTPGELRIRMGVSNPNLFQMLRLPQVDMTMAVAEAQVPKEVPGEMKTALDRIATGQSVRSLTFLNTRDMHTFMFALTGYQVHFDGFAASFAITRRRMVVPVHKKWEAGTTRIVIAEREGVLQMLVFFEDFHYGHCMGLVLKRTDEFEAFGRNGKFGLRILDAKFPLPQIPKEKDRERMEMDGSGDYMAFVCLDSPEIPGEHDDISIVFERDEERTQLCSVLPSETKGLR